jgi:hypothetical protein
MGLLTLKGLGPGATKRAGTAGVVVTSLGLLTYALGMAVVAFVAPDLEVFYAAGTLLTGCGMLLLGIAVVIAKRLTGWLRYAPLLVGL